MKPVSPDIHFPKLEESILSFWKEHQIIQKGLRMNEGQKSFLFYDGPPFATGLPHYGHLLAGTLKDVVPRYWAMKGNYVERRWGWDCHGLPVEFEMENELGLSGYREVEKFGVAKFNDACRQIVQRYTKEWEEVVRRTGRWVDFENQYRTMDTPFMETVWWVLKQLWDKGLVFEGHRVMPYSWRIATPLSNFEASLNYKEVQDPALTCRFKSKKFNRYFLAWTTTPWTLPSNLALAVNKDVDYVEIEENQTKDHYVLAESRLAAYFKTPDDYRVCKNFKGKDLEHETYEPLFPHFIEKASEGAFQVVLGEHVTDTDGTGLVHTAPAFGEEDFQVAHKYKIPLVDPTDHEGRFTEALPEFAGQNIKEADKGIIKYLKEKGSVFKHDTYVHNYPFCWRSDTPLMQKAISTWFVRLDPLKEKLLKNNQKTHWVPEHLREGRFGNWLENARDWNISRNRFWGTPLPIWKCKPDCGGAICIGSIEELKKQSGKVLNDLHKQFVDEVKIPCPKCGILMNRIPEVLDCWFESGSMPYGQQHYPFENKEKFEAAFPADFIAEGIDQTRGWFYTLSVLSTALFDKPPFKNVIVNGLVLAEDGKKMSKRLKNYPDPKYLLDTYGADALRAYLMNSPASHAEDLRFSEAGVKEVVRGVLLPLWNAYSFFVTYARADEWTPTARSFDVEKLSHPLDQWVISRLQSLLKKVEERMECYHLYEVVPEVISFIDELTNWYIRLNRRRFWSDEKSKEKEQAYETLYFVLNQFTKLLAPVLPFVTEAIYQNLNWQNLNSEIKGEPESIHLCRYPEAEVKWVKRSLEEEMGLVQKVVYMGRTIRNTHKIKTRQPLKEFLIITQNPEDKKAIEAFSDLISSELNVKKVSFTHEEEKWVNLTAKANAKVLGPKLGQKMKLVLQEVKELTPEQVSKLEKEGELEVAGERLTLEDVVIDRAPKQEGLIQSAGGVTVWFDTQLTQELIQEGLARELVNRVQKLRKEMGLEVTDRIELEIATSSELKQAFQNHERYIQEEVLASKKLQFADNLVSSHSEQEIEGNPVSIRVKKSEASPQS